MNLKGLTKPERARYMQLQMSPASSRYGGYLPDDCSECGACGEPILGSGWCQRCSSEFDTLRTKALAREVAP